MGNYQGPYIGHHPLSVSQGVFARAAAQAAADTPVLDDPYWAGDPVSGHSQGFQKASIRATNPYGAQGPVRVLQRAAIRLHGVGFDKSPTTAFGA